MDKPINMPASHYFPMLELTRGEARPDGAYPNIETVESIHYGAAAVVDAHGNTLAWYGDPQTVTFLRSSAKPFQAMPFFERGGQEHYQLDPCQIAILCSSHSGTDDHMNTVQSIQVKAGINESDLLCGTHPVFDPVTAKALRERHEKPTPNRHNCSGKHTGMLAFARMQNQPIENYLDPQHPIQKTILSTFADMVRFPEEEIALGTDGCSAPVFAIPLYNAALGFARLCDPHNGQVSPSARVDACQLITTAMTSNPDMVAGPGRFDTLLMQAYQGKVLSKAGAEAFQALGIMPGVLHSGSPGIGIAYKISDGDNTGRARRAVGLEILRQLGLLAMIDIQPLTEFGPEYPIFNWRKLKVGRAQPCFALQS
ncbi:MAG: asparaginase [Anaerolineales bacterium]|nr:asparaginase [Anaerolineales bacterium]